MGEERASRALEAPDCPEEIEYLWEWAIHLHGRSGAVMGGLLPLSPSVLRDWSDLMGVCLEPEEVEALIAIDAALLAASRSPEDGRREEPEGG